MGFFPPLMGQAKNGIIQYNGALANKLNSSHDHNCKSNLFQLKWIEIALPCPHPSKTPIKMCIVMYFLIKYHLQYFYFLQTYKHVITQLKRM